MAATPKRGVNGSAMNTSPPNAASSGTDNCTSADETAVWWRNAAYQIT